MAKPTKKEEAEAEKKKMEAKQWSVQNRTRRLADIVGNRTLKAAVRGMIETGEIPGTIMLLGPTGHGKTTIARIIANRLLKVKDCSKETDCHEYNCSSDRGIDFIRDQIIKNAPFRPMNCPFRVFILDEVHGLGDNTPAASAILKIIEEPPPHCIFILGTNLPEKVNKAILGRATKLTLETPEPAEVAAMLKRVMEDRDIKPFNEKVLIRIAEVCGSQPRESIQLLQTAYLIHRGDKELGLKAVIEQAIRQQGSFEADQTTFKLLLAMYKKSAKAVLRVLVGLPDDAYRTIIYKGLEMHNVMLYHGAERRANYYSDPRKWLLNALKEANLNPTAEESMAVHAVLADIHMSMNSFLLKEYPLMIWKIGNYIRAAKRRK